MEIRADVALVQSGLVASRTAAQKAIAERRAYAENVLIEKPSQKLPETAVLRVSDSDAYVSRGAYKLLGALSTFGFSPEGMVCADIGASTGGFTQVLLQHGASRVYAVDVGTNQLAQCLRGDPRVISIENCNARQLHEGSLPEKVDLIVYDVSFISATLLFDAMLAIGADDCAIIGLIKPQFEAGRAAVGKNGIVKSKADHERAINRTRDSALAKGLSMTHIAVSPIHGGDGNIEYLSLLQRNGRPVPDEGIKQTVALAHKKKPE